MAIPAPLSDVPLPPVDASVPPWPGAQIDLDGTSVHVRTTPGPAGGGEPALYVHGLGGASTNWTDLAGLLSGWLDGAALDLPGFGRSGPAPNRDYSLRSAARTVVRLIERTGRGPVHLFGNSMGGAASVLVAARRPDLVRTLTLVSPAMPDIRFRPGSDPLIPLLLLPGVSRLAERRLERLTPEQRARAVINLCFGDPSLVPANRIAEAAEEIRRRKDLPWTMSAFTASLRGLAFSYLRRGERSLWQVAAKITAPTLVVWGDRDRLVDVALAPRTAETVRDGRVLVLPGVGHTAQLEAPEAVARAFLALRDHSDAVGEIARRGRDSA